MTAEAIQSKLFTENEQLKQLESVKLSLKVSATQFIKYEECDNALAAVEKLKDVIQEIVFKKYEIKNLHEKLEEEARAAIL